MADRIVCPVCEKEITEQVTIEFPVTQAGSKIGKRSQGYGILVYKGGDYFLIREGVITCPSCHEVFGFDICVKLEDMQTDVKERKE